MNDVPQRPRTPPGWLNSLMRVMLRTPGIQWLVGRSTALLTFTGRKSGRPFTTPVTYVRQGDAVIITCDQSRQWWRNLETHPQVGLRLAGKSVQGTARIHRSGPQAVAYLATFFERQRMAARAAGVGFDAAGKADRGDVEARLGETVVMSIDLAPASTQA